MSALKMKIIPVILFIIAINVANSYSAITIKNINGLFFKVERLKFDSNNPEIIMAYLNPCPGQQNAPNPGYMVLRKTDWGECAYNQLLSTLLVAQTNNSSIWVVTSSSGYCTNLTTMNN